MKFTKIENADLPTYQVMVLDPEMNYKLRMSIGTVTRLDATLWEFRADSNVFNAEFDPWAHRGIRMSRKDAAQALVDAYLKDNQK